MEQFYIGNRQHDMIDYRGLTGLQNMGNTCYLNSVLQMFSNTTDFRVYFTSRAYHKKLIENIKSNLELSNCTNVSNVSVVFQKQMCYQFERLYKNIWNPLVELKNSQILKPVSFKTVLGAKYRDFDTCNQQDAHECITTILNIIENEIGCSCLTEIEYEHMELKTLSAINLLKKGMEKYKVGTDEWNDLRIDLRIFEDNFPNMIKRFAQIEYLKNKYSRKYSICDELFSFGQTNTLVCSECKYKSHNYEDGYTLMIDIPEVITSKEEVLNKMSIADDQSIDINAYLEADSNDDYETWKQKEIDKKHTLKMACNSQYAQFQKAMDECTKNEKYELIDCINSSFKCENLEDNITCNFCCNKTKMTKTNMLSHVSKYLIITLKRFDFARQAKKSQLINIPEFINIENHLDKDILPHLKNTNMKYKLISIIHHKGTFLGGHYYTTVYNANLKKWFNIDDDSVKEISTYNSQNAYILMYEKIDTDKIHVTVQSENKQAMQTNVQLDVSPNMQSENKQAMQTNVQLDMLPNMQPNVQQDMQPNVRLDMLPNVQQDMQPNVQQDMQPNVQQDMQKDAQKKYDMLLKNDFDELINKMF